MTEVSPEFQMASDYVSIDIDDISKLAEDSLDVLAGIADPDTCTEPFPPIMHNVWALLTDAVLKVEGFDKFAIGLPRGHGKTIVIKLLVLFIILFTKRQFVLVTCSTEENAINIVSDVADILDSPNIVAIFGNWRLNLQVDRATLKKFTFKGRPIILKPIGSNSSVRGINIKNRRPDVMIFDDMQTKENAKDPTQARTLQQWLLGTVMKAKSPKTCTYIYVGNMYPSLPMDPTAPNNGLVTCILNNLKNNKNWTSWIVGAILTDGTALWPEVHPIENLLAELENDVSMGEAEQFFAEVLNDPSCGNLKYFNFSKIPPMPYDPKYDQPTGRFILIDPSLGKKTSDGQECGLFEVFGDKVYLKELRQYQVTSPELVEKVIAWALEARVPAIIAETVSYQSTLLTWFMNKCQEKNIDEIQFLSVHPKKRSKPSRILNMFKLVMAGGLHLNPDAQSRFLVQASQYDPNKAHNDDDVLDLCAYVEDVLVNYTWNIVVPELISTTQEFNPYEQDNSDSDSSFGFSFD